MEKVYLATDCEDNISFFIRDKINKSMHLSKIKLDFSIETVKEKYPFVLKFKFDEPNTEVEYRNLRRFWRSMEEKLSNFILQI